MIQQIFTSNRIGIVPNPVSQVFCSGRPRIHKGTICKQNRTNRFKTVCNKCHYFCIFLWTHINVYLNAGCVPHHPWAISTWCNKSIMHKIILFHVNQAYIFRWINWFKCIINMHQILFIQHFSNPFKINLKVVINFMKTDKRWGCPLQLTPRFQRIAGFNRIVFLIFFHYFHKCWCRKLFTQINR